MRWRRMPIARSRGSLAGAYCRFDAGSAHQLGELLRAVAAYAAGGIKALTDLSKKRSASAQQLLSQLK